MRDGDLGHRFRAHRPDRELAQPLRTDAEHQVGQRLGVPRFEGDRPRVAPAADRLQLGDVRRGLLVRLVLQQPREQQVPRLQQRQVLLVLDLGRGQQPGRLQVEQGGGDEQELARLVQVPLVAHGAQVRDELVGDLVQRDLGDVQLVLADQLEQQVERAGEVVQPDREATRLFAGARIGGHHTVDLGGQLRSDGGVAGAVRRVEGRCGHRETVDDAAGGRRATYRSAWAAMTSRASCR